MMKLIGCEIYCDRLIKKANELIQKIEESCHSEPVIRLTNELKELIGDGVEGQRAK